MIVPLEYRGSRRNIMKLATLLCLTVSATWLVPTADATIIRILLYRFLWRLFPDACQYGLRFLGNKFESCTCQLDKTLRGTNSADFSCSIPLAECLLYPNLSMVTTKVKSSLVSFRLLISRRASRAATTLLADHR
jgi:hypothetical protein